MLMSKIESINLPKHSPVIEWLQFRSLKRKEDETINNFKAQARNKASHCEFNTCECAR